MTNGMGKTVHQPNGPCGLDKWPSSLANVLQVVGQPDAFHPRQGDINLMTLFCHSTTRGNALILSRISTHRSCSIALPEGSHCTRKKLPPGPAKRSKARCDSQNGLPIRSSKK